MVDELDWSKLPPNLAFLAEPAGKYGGFQFGDKIYGFLNRMSETERAELTALVVKWKKPESEELARWLDMYPMTEHREACLVYFLFHLVALGNDAGFFSPRSDK